MPTVYDKQVTRTMTLDTEEVVELIRKHYGLEENTSIEVSGEDTGTAEYTTVSLTSEPLDASNPPIEIHVREQYQEK